jgi:hypothetical protein
VDVEFSMADSRIDWRFSEFLDGPALEPVEEGRAFSLNLVNLD